MLKLQRFVRKCTNHVLLCNESVLLDLQGATDMITAETFALLFQSKYTMYQFETTMTNTTFTSVYCGYT